MSFLPWALGLPGADIRGTWDRDAPPQKGPDDRIAWLQKLLRRAGYEFGPVDGIVGPKTHAAINRFQASAGLDQSGEFDAPMVTRLREMAEAATVVVEKPVVPPSVEQKVNRRKSASGGNGSPFSFPHCPYAAFCQVAWR